MCWVSSNKKTRNDSIHGLQLNWCQCVLIGPKRIIICYQETSEKKQCQLFSNLFSRHTLVRVVPFFLNLLDSLEVMNGFVILLFNVLLACRMWTFSSRRKWKLNDLSNCFECIQWYHCKKKKRKRKEKQLILHLCDRFVHWMDGLIDGSIELKLIDSLTLSFIVSIWLMPCSYGDMQIDLEAVLRRAPNFDERALASSSQAKAEVEYLLQHSLKHDTVHQKKNLYQSI